jgi:hypothetical protein
MSNYTAENCSFLPLINMRNQSSWSEHTNNYMSDWRSPDPVSRAVEKTKFQNNSYLVFNQSRNSQNFSYRGAEYQKASAARVMRIVDSSAPATADSFLNKFENVTKLLREGSSSLKTT